MTIINNRNRLDRIIRELDPIWPDENSNYGILFSYSGKKRDFYPRRKPIIKALLYHPTEEYEKVLQGRIIEFRVDQKRQFEIDTHEGIVNKQYVFSINDENALVSGQLSSV